MGRKGDGVIVREKSIRLAFTIEGKTYFRTIKVNGKTLHPTPANLKFASRLAQEIKDKIRLGLFNMFEYFPANGENPSGITVRSQLSTWLGTQRIAGSTKSGYETAIRFWENAVHDPKAKQSFGDTLLKAVKPSHIMTIIASKPQLSGKTLNNYRDVLASALQLAITEKLIETNPMETVKRAKYQKDPPDPFEPIERDSIIESIKYKYEEQVYNLIEFWFWTGLRTSELFGLRWGNVDFNKNTVRIQETYVRGEHKDSTKTNVVRDVRLNSITMEVIRRQKAHTFLAGEFVFHDPRYNEPWNDERAFRRSFWTPTLKRLGIRYRRPYNCRHTYATVMLMAGMNHAFCARQLGHSIEVFLGTYAKWIDGLQDDQEMRRLEDNLQNSCRILAKNR